MAGSTNHRGLSASVSFPVLVNGGEVKADTPHSEKVVCLILIRGPSCMLSLCFQTVVIGCSSPATLSAG